MMKPPAPADEIIEFAGNRVSYRNMPSYRMEFHNHKALQVLIPLDNANFEISWELENTETESKQLAAGDICIIPPLLGHEVRWINCAHFVNFYITSQFVYDASNHNYDRESELFSVIMGLRDPFIFHLGHAIKQMAMRNQAHNYQYYEAATTMLANYLINNHTLKGNQLPSTNDSTQLPCDKIRSAMAFMSHRVNRKIGIGEIAAELGISQYHFIRRFRKEVGMSPNKYHMIQRIEKAKELLKGQKKIIDIAYDLGFSSQSHFSNAFSKSVGITPLKFQQSQ